MYLLAACTISWLCLIGAFITTWVHLPAPRSTTDLVVIIVVGTAAVLFSRVGVVSLLTMLVRLLPHGRMRTMATKTVLRIVPTMLRSSVLAAASASLVVHAAHASPLPADALAVDDHRVFAATAAAPSLDPGWPTAVPDDTPSDPGWPTTPPAPRSEPSPYQNAPTTDDEAEVHIVGAGESLWSIAADQPSSRGVTQDIVDDIYSDNRDVIGANPNLIMPGQRLEIQL